LRYGRDPIGLLHRYARQYGDPFTMSLLGSKWLITGHPEYLREIFTADPDVFESSGERLLLPLVGRHSVLLSSGAVHRRKRKLLLPPFHGARMRTYGELIRDEALEMAATWRPGLRIDMLAVAQTLSLDVIIRVVFGVQEPERVAHFREVITASVNAFVPALLLVPALQRELFGLGPWSRFRQRRDALMALLRHEIRSRRALPRGEDILSLLLDARDEDGELMSDDELVDELRTLLIGGYETTAIAMAWAFYELLRPSAAAVLGRLLDELAPLGPAPAPEDLARHPYLGAVCDEVLRLHPLAAMTVRRTHRPYVLKDLALPAGMHIGIAFPLAHLDESLYPEPRRFRPERFLERKYTPFEFFPFGGGARRCMGAALAGYEMRIMLGGILTRHRLRLADERPVVTEFRGLTLGPRGGIQLVYDGVR
jgi:cytochrome P450